MGRSAILLALLCAGCGSSSSSLGFAVAITLDADASVSDAALASVRGVAFHASGGETFDGVDAVTALARTERVIYRPASDTRALEIEIDAVDAAMNVVASGSTGQLALNTNETDRVEVTLSAPGTPDGGADFTGGFDLSGDLHSNCGGGGAYCYTFEGGDDSPSLQLDPSCIIVDNPVQAHSGNSYLSCVSSGLPSTASGTIDVGSAGQSEVYFRAWLRITPSGTPLFASFSGLSVASFTPYMNFGTDGNGELSLNYTSPTDTLELSSTQAADTQGAWHCFEMLLDRGVTPSTLSFYLDSALVNSATNAFEPDTFTLTLLGIIKDSQEGSTVAMTVDTDDAVIAYSRLGCP